MICGDLILGLSLIRGPLSQNPLVEYAALGFGVTGGRDKSSRVLL